MQAIFNSGTPYNLVSTPATVVMGRTPLHLPRRRQRDRRRRVQVDPQTTQAVQVTIPAPQRGRVKTIQAQAVISLAGCTLDDPATVTLKLRRTNHNAADLPGSMIAVTIGIIGTSGQNEQDIPVMLPRVPYNVTRQAPDTIQLWAWIDWGQAVGTSGQGTSGQEIPTTGVVTIRQASIIVEP
jgi:hypothetical protein